MLDGPTYSRSSHIHGGAGRRWRSHRIQDSAEDGLRGIQDSVEDGLCGILEFAENKLRGIQDFTEDWTLLRVRQEVCSVVFSLRIQTFRIIP